MEALGEAQQASRERVARLLASPAGSPIGVDGPESESEPVPEPVPFADDDDDETEFLDALSYQDLVDGLDEADAGAAALDREIVWLQELEARQAERERDDEEARLLAEAKSRRAEYLPLSDYVRVHTVQEGESDGDTVVETAGEGGSESAAEASVEDSEEEEKEEGKKEPEAETSFLMRAADRITGGLATPVVGWLTSTPGAAATEPRRSTRSRVAKKPCKCQLCIIKQ